MDFIFIKSSKAGKEDYGSIYARVRTGKVNMKVVTGFTIKQLEWEKYRSLQYTSSALHILDPEFPIFSTTLCYLEREDAYLMLHRIKKQDDYNHDKWVGVGGKFERFESPEDCLVREVREETGLTLTRYRARGLLTFVWGNMTEFIHLYTADRWEGEMIRGDACAEGELQWVQKSEVQTLPIWEGDKLFFRLLEEEHPYFSLKLVYEGDTLTQAVLDGKRIV